MTDKDRINAIESMCLMVNQSAPRKAVSITQDGERFTGDTAREVIDLAMQNLDDQNKPKEQNERSSNRIGIP